LRDADAIIVGAGPAGLACAVTMQAAGLKATVLEKADGVGAVWRRHYDRLHLHTDRNHSGLPGMAMPNAFPTYPSREQMVEYLETYAARFDISPVFNTTVSRVRRDGARWSVDTNGSTISAPLVVVATGIADAPYRPSWPGSELYRGAVVHSSDYRNPASYQGKRVLVVNAMGRVFMDPLDDPFAALERELAACPLKTAADAIIVDMHGEATSEKQAMGHFCDGRASLVVGTHTHVPTADHQILTGGTAYMTDAGMTGDYDSIIGMQKDEPLRRFTTGIPSGRFEPALGVATLSGVAVETDDATGLALKIAPVRIGGRLEPTLPGFWVA